jgi:pimeloyl-ACP methyl ester carboxylesterase
VSSPGAKPGSLLSRGGLERRELRLHGHPVAYYTAGSGPVVLLIHGITSSADAWREVVPALAEHYTVVAPDLLGHGGSAKPRGDYSLGAYASGLRDLLAALGHERATVVGHSMGGGIAMVLAYQFPERVERLGLVSSGGLGKEVGIVLRAATLPGAGLVLPVITRRGPRDVVLGGAQVLSRLGLRTRADVRGTALGLASLRDPDARRAFIHTARSIIDSAGQRVSAHDRLYLAAGMPTLLLWGDRDPMIPSAHGIAAHAAIPHSRLELFEGAGHYPFEEDPKRFVRVLREFVAMTEPSSYDEEEIRRRLVAGAPG